MDRFLSTQSVYIQNDCQLSSNNIIRKRDIIHNLSKIENLFQGIITWNIY